MLKNNANVGIFFILIMILLSSLISCTQTKERQITNTSEKLVKLQSQKCDNAEIKSSNQEAKFQNPCNISNTGLQKTNYSGGLLSPRVYAGLLEPQSYLINNFEPLKDDLNTFLEEQNISASIYVENLRNGANMGIHEKRNYFPASLNKLPVAVLIMQEVEDGKLSLNATLNIRDSERTSTSGALYLTNATKLTIKELLERMLKESDNTAFNVLYGQVDKEDLARLLSYYAIRINVNNRQSETGGIYLRCVA